MKIFEQIEGRTIIEKSPVAILQRRWMALLAAVFPLFFLASSFLLCRTDFQLSISSYYWTLDTERNIFIGLLCFIASYLILYKGYTRFEDGILDLAGGCAVGIALFPVPKEPGISAHYVFAVLFFVCIFVACIAMSRKTLSQEMDERRKNIYWIWYRLCSAVMIAICVFALVMIFLPEETSEALRNMHVIFWMEAFGIWAFSAYWYIKSRELDPTLSFIPLRRKKAGL